MFLEISDKFLSMVQANQSHSLAPKDTQKRRAGDFRKTRKHLEEKCLNSGPEQTH